MKNIKRLNVTFMLFYCLVFSSVSYVSAQSSASSSQGKEQQQVQKLTLTDAIMCEEIRELLPYHPTIALSISFGKAVCYTVFDPVPERTIIYHNWFRHDILSTSIKLALQPPRWATFSTIQLREADKGPWRVEITDQNKRVFKILRFSITD